MVNNPGFLVQYDRFSLNDEAEYILQGYLAPGASVRAELDGKEHPAEVRMLTDHTDERTGARRPGSPFISRRRISPRSASGS